MPHKIILVIMFFLLQGMNVTEVAHQFRKTDEFLATKVTFMFFRLVASPVLGEIPLRVTHVLTFVARMNILHARWVYRFHVIFQMSGCREPFVTK